MTNLQDQNLRSKYPVLEKLDAVLTSLRQNPITILQAPPGSGKTTFLPLELLKANLIENKKILILEPRRIAAKNAARRLAQNHGSEIGSEIGYRIRFESQVSKNTKLEVVTDGILTRMLLADPEISEYGLIILDEFHERKIDSDFCLALLRRAQQLFRKDLKILIMSATLDGINFESLEQNISTIYANGQSFPVDIVYQGDSDKRQSLRLADLIPKVISAHNGDVLVFFSGVSEIHEAERELNKVIGENPFTTIHKLYGDMSFEEQEKVFKIEPADKRKVILATNIAESSITIPNVRVVVDTGFCKRSIFEPSSGLTRLEKVRISLSSAKQRSGRAGREAPGTSYRLWSKETESSFVHSHRPEILESDISHLVLLSYLWGENIAELPLLDHPGLGTINELNRLLTTLNCLNENAQVTNLGRNATLLPLPLRISVMCIRLAEIGRSVLAAELAAVFTEIRTINDSKGELLEFTGFWENWKRSKNIDHFPKLKQIKTQLIKILDTISFTDTTVDQPILEKDDIGLLLSLAFPDRIAKRRSLPNSKKYKLSNGKGAALEGKNILNPPEWIVVLDSNGDETEAKITMYCEIDELNIFTIHKQQLVSKQTHVLENNEKSPLFLKSYQEEMFGEISMKQIPASRSKDILAKQKAIFDYFAKHGVIKTLFSDPLSAQLLHRINLLNNSPIHFPNINEDYFLNNLESWYFPLFDLEKSNVDLFDFDRTSAILSVLNYNEREILDKEAPLYFIVPSGSKIKIQYSDGSAILAVKLQELFGLSETPRIVGAQMPVTFHLLSPSGKPVQITKDLKNFWNITYHEVKKELKGRYPRHPWPDAPWEAVPTKGTKKRMLH